MCPLISVVDDDTSVLRSLENLLASAGFDVVTFSSAEAFLASDSMFETACLILDLSMPGMSGVELFARVGELERPIPTVILTAVTEHHERERLLLQGARGYLMKPVRAAEMLAAIDAALVAP